MGIWDHNYLWVLDTDACGGVDKVVSVAQKTGYGVCAKYHDGDPSDDARYGFKPKFGSLVAACRPLRIPIIAWGYCYGNAYGNLAKEYAAAVDSFASGAQAYVIDAEIEWEVATSKAWANEFMSKVKESVPSAEIAVTTFWNLRWHPSVPASEFARAGAVAMPQTYYASARRTTRESREKMHSIANEDFTRAGFSSIFLVAELPSEMQDSVQPEVPEGSVPRDLTDFMEIVGKTPHSLWLLDKHQDSAAMQFLADLKARESP